MLVNPARDLQRRKLTPDETTVSARGQFQLRSATIGHSGGRRDGQRKTKAGAHLVELLADPGRRAAEATALRWSDVSFDSQCVTSPGGEVGTKSSQSRTLPMTGALRDRLLRLRAETQPAEHEFISHIKDAKQCLTTACSKPGLPRFTQPDFRHLFPTTCLVSGVDIPTVSRSLGHK